MNFLEPIDYFTDDFPDFFDELPLWSARFGAMLLERVPMRPEMTILDVGCGTGFLAIELAQRCGDQCRVIAVDPWSSATNRLLKKITRHAIENIHVLTQEIADSHLNANSVDLIVSNLGINNFADPQRAMQACYEFAKPGAVFLLTTNLVGHFQEFYDAYFKILSQQSDSSAADALRAHVAHRATIDNVKKLLTESGFEIDRVDEACYQERFANGSALFRHRFIRLAFVQDWKKVLPPTQIAPVFASLEQELNRVALMQGGLALTVPMACISAKKPLF